MKPDIKLCKRFEKCDAPLCPIDERSLIGGTWYPDEEFCTSRAYSNLPWIKRQRKISKKVRNKDSYFNYEMLCRNCRITAATEGLDPDRTDITEGQQLKRWFKQHPEMRKMSEKEKTELVRRLNRGLYSLNKKAI